MGRLLRRLMMLAILAGAAAAVMRMVRGSAECGPNCDCSQGAATCYCGHDTCLAPAGA